VGETKAYGAVYHFPKFLTNWMGNGTTFSLFFNHNSNFEAQAPRTSLLGDTLPNPTGKTKEYGFILSTLNDKVSLKVNWYRTGIQNATLDSSNDAGLGATATRYGPFRPGVTSSRPSFRWHARSRDPEQLRLRLELCQQRPDGWNRGPHGQHAVHTEPERSRCRIGTADHQCMDQHPDPGRLLRGLRPASNSINPALAKASGNLVDGMGGTSQFNPNSWNNDQPGSLNPVTTVDTLSEARSLS